MRNIEDILVSSEAPRLTNTAGHRFDVDTLVSELDANGIVALPNLLSVERLRDMQKAFAVKLRRMRWNSIDGYYKMESIDTWSQMCCCSTRGSLISRCIRWSKIS